MNDPEVRIGRGADCEAEGFTLILPSGVYEPGVTRCRNKMVKLVPGDTLKVLEY
jgi:hypothetical protein